MLDGQVSLRVLSWVAVRRSGFAFLLLLAMLTAGPAAARVPRTLKLRFPAVTVDPSENVEECLFLRANLSGPFDLTSWEITERGSHKTFVPQHLLMYWYTGAHSDQLPVGTAPRSRGCVAPGPDDRQSRELIASGFVGSSRGIMPTGVAIRLEPQNGVIGFLLDAEWNNGEPRTRRGRTTVVLHRAKPGTISRIAQPLLEHTAEEGIAVAPASIRSTEDSTSALGRAPDAFAPPADACVMNLTAHFRQRGLFFGVDLLNAQGAVIPPTETVENPVEPGRVHRYGAHDFTDPGVLKTVLPVQAGERLHYACWHDNGVARPQRLGCEESVGVAPGSALGSTGGVAAKPCSSPADCPATDAAYPGRTFTGACVPAVLTGSTLTDDEGCSMAGFVYDAAPNGSCDVSAVPPTS